MPTRAPPLPNSDLLPPSFTIRHPPSASSKHNFFYQPEYLQLSIIYVVAAAGAAFDIVDLT